jgi:putative methyltransferase (TIGR04325 family)
MLKRRIPEGVQTAVQNWLPPVAVTALKRALGSVSWSGDYPSFAHAMAECEGYDAQVILDRVTEAALAVKEGRAAYERDSVPYQQKTYVWHVLAGLLWTAAKRDGRLSVLDFGGSLGSTYYQHKSWLEDLRHFKWSIVEQPSFVDVGQEKFEDGTLRFFHDVPSALAAERANTLLVSSVFQYLEEPYAKLEELLDCDFDVVIIDRTGFTLDGRDRLTVQRVGERIYPASYPCWFFDRARFLRIITERYRLVNEFPAIDRANLPVRYEAFMFERRADR